MDLLDWARGPLLAAALIVFLAGSAWRILALRRLPPGRVAGVARRPYGTAAAAGVAARRFWPRHGLPASSTLATFNPYLYHVGLAVVVFGYAPHIAFVQRLTGISWPALPDAAMYLAAGVTITSLALALLFRVTDPVLRRISRADDHLTWALTLLPLLTGMALVGEPSPHVLARELVVYRTPLAIHLLSVELLLAWFPFGKLMHGFLAVPARMQLAHFLGRRGVRP